jgi:hypothetical protein
MIRSAPATGAASKMTRFRRKAASFTKEAAYVRHRRQRLGLQNIRSDHGTTTLAQHGAETSCGCREFRTLLLRHLIDGLNADHNRIAFSGLHEFQHQFCQVFAQSYAFGTHS